MKSVVDCELVVWVVDDDLVSLYAAQYGIQQWNTSCKVIDFDCAETALRIFADILEEGAQPPDIILLDLVMPRMNGWEFLAQFEALQSKCKKTDVYVLSAFSNSKDRLKAQEHISVKGYFDKPISKMALDEILVTRNY